MDATSARTVITSRSPKDRLEAILAGLYVGPDEYLTPEEADVLNSLERERFREAQARMAANPCITFSGIPTMRIWRPGDIKPPSIAYRLLQNPAGIFGQELRSCVPPVDLTSSPLGVWNFGVIPEG
jgi:hypothetical protein